MALPALYIISAEYQAAAQQLADLELDEQTIADTLESMAGDLEAKCTNVAAFVRNLEAFAVNIKQAEEDMASRRKAIEARAKRVRDYLKANMEACGISKIESPWFKISIRQNPESVAIDADLMDLPTQYLRIKEVCEADKTAIKEALQSGNAVAGCHLQRTSRIEIK